MLIILFISILTLAITIMAYRIYIYYRKPPVTTGWISHRKRRTMQILNQRN